MGNWRTVHITGECGADDAAGLSDHLSVDRNCGPLGNGGICGLHDWPGERIDACGNLYERGYSVEDVADDVRKLIREVAPSLRVRIDCGGDYESLDCVATILCDEDGTVAVLPPMVETLPAISDEHMAAGLFEQLMRYQ